MGDEQGCTPFQHPSDGALDLVLCGTVDGAGRVVQDQDARIREQSPGDRNPLALSTREVTPRSPTTVW